MSSWFTEDELRLLKYARGKELKDTWLRRYEAGKDYVTFGGLRKPLTGDGLRMLHMGEAGSGKSLSIKKSLIEVVSHIRAGGKRRAMLFDPKGELLSELIATGTDYKILQVYNPDTVRLDLANEFPSSSDGARLAELLIPIPGDRSQKDPFDHWARSLIEGVHFALLMHTSRTGESWQLLELLLPLLLDRSKLQQLMYRHPYTKATFDKVFGIDAPGRASGVERTLTTHLKGLKDVAMYWAWGCRGKEWVTLKDWAQGEYTLVLGHHSSYDPACRALNHLIVERAVDRVMERADSSESWFILDELNLLGELNSVAAMVDRGRSYKVSLLATCSTYSAIRHVYGAEGADHLLGLFSDKAFLYNTDPATCEWVERVMGRNRVTRWLRGYSNDGGTYGATTSEQVVEEARLINGRLQQLPKCSPQNGLHGFYLDSNLGFYPNHQTWSQLVAGQALAAPVEPRRMPKFPPEQFAWDRQLLNKYGLS